MKTILVTGGAGFIGSHLCEELLQQGHHVICVDNFFTGSKKNIEPFLGNSQFELIRHDISLLLYLECDQIYNLACPASPKHYQYNAIKTIKCNTIGMLNVLGLAKRTKARLLQASTSEIYGNPYQHPQTEEYWGNVNPLGLRACYDEGKRVAETLCLGYHRQNNVDVRIVRIFNTYGPRMAVDDGRVISNFIVQALRGEQVTIHGDGQQTRSFQYVADLIKGLIAFMNQDTHHGPINIGNPQEHSILEIAQKILQLTNSTSSLVFTARPEDDPHRRSPDISLAKKVIGWEPQVQLEEGLQKTIEYFKSVL